MSGKSPDWDKLRKLVRERHGYIGSDMDILMPLIDAVEELQKHSETFLDHTAVESPVIPRRGGRPLGSKNKK